MDSPHDKTANGTPLPDPARVAAARKRLSDSETSVREWAQTNGENTALVYKVLTGDRPCVIGASRRIAEKLGIVGDDPDDHRDSVVATIGAAEAAR